MVSKRTWLVIRGLLNNLPSRWQDIHRRCPGKPRYVSLATKSTFDFKPDCDLDKLCQVVSEMNKLNRQFKLYRNVVLAASIQKGLSDR